jgi:hypothetical protein
VADDGDRAADGDMVDDAGAAADGDRPDPVHRLSAAGHHERERYGGSYYSPILFLVLGGAIIALAIERTGCTGGSPSPSSRGADRRPGRCCSPS